MMWYGFGGWWMGVSMVLFWAGVVLLVVWAVRGMSAGGRTPAGDRRAVEILDERFARGEIDREEYEQRRSTLERNPS